VEAGSILPRQIAQVVAIGLDPDRVEVVGVGGLADQLD
jgi:hypothetical protein